MKLSALCLILAAIVVWGMFSARAAAVCDTTTCLTETGSWSSGCFVRLVESEASDAIADHDNSDHEQNHDHDCHIVLHQPLP